MGDLNRANAVNIKYCQECSDSFDMTINTKKSCCLRIRPRHDKPCADIVTQNGQIIPWVDEVRYLGVHIVKLFRFKCSVEYAKRSFYRSANGILGKVGILAFQEIVLLLQLMKRVPILVVLSNAHTSKP